MRTFCLFCLICTASFVFTTSQASASINNTLLKEANLHTVWQTGIALNPKERTEVVTVLGNYIYILTSSNYLFCIDRNDGREVFALAAADERLPVSQPADFNNIVYFIAANNILAINLTSGAELYRKKIEYPVTARPAVNAEYFYLAGTTKQLHMMNHEFHDLHKIDSDDSTKITSVICDSNSVFFATMGGQVYCMDTNMPVKKWRFDTVGAIEAPIVEKNGAIYVSGKDTNLYKLNAKKGKQMWKFFSGSFLTTSARVPNKVVYQYARNKGVYAIDANSGKQMWLDPDGSDLLAEDGNTAYIISSKNICEVMDNTTAKKLYTINLEAVTAFATNPYDSKMYVIEDKKVICIEPMKK